MNKFICNHCGKVYNRNDEYTKWNKWTRCECGENAIYDRYVGQTKIAGYNSPGYNEGLGVYIKDKSDLTRTLKERNLEEVGNG